MAKDLCSPDHHHHHHLFPKVFCVYYHHHRRPQIIIESNQAKIVIIIINNNSTKATIISISATKYWSSIENENNLWKRNDHFIRIDHRLITWCFSKKNTRRKSDTKFNYQTMIGLYDFCVFKSNIAAREIFP